MTFKIRRNIFMDTEFVEDGKTIDLISIALVEDDRRFYAVSNEFNAAKAKAHPFVSEHVLPLLPHRSTIWDSRSGIRTGIHNFIGDPEGVRFWADYGSYDWIAFCQLFGTMSDLPEGYPMFIHDFRQLLGKRGKFDPVVKPEDIDYDGKPHDALYDALHLQERFNRLKRGILR